MPEQQHKISVFPSSRGLFSVDSERKRNQAQWVKIVVCTLYVLFSLGCGIWFLIVMPPYLLNILFWPEFNQSSHQALLVDVANHALIAPPIADQITSLWHPKSYQTLNPTTVFYNSYARRLALAQLVSLEYIVPILRHLPMYIAKNPHIQQCWVDFNKTWEVAHTSARQDRCATKYAHNGAVYYESILRNIDLNLFLEAYGGPDNEFTVAIQLAVLETYHGAAWFNATSIAREIYDIPMEITYWKNFGISEYRYLWQNYASTGLSESISIQNSLGIGTSVMVKSSPNAIGSWTSIICFWLPGNDWYVAQGNNMSLVRGATNDFRIYDSFESYLGMNNGPNGTFIEQTGLIHSRLGELLSIDPWLISLPKSILQLYGSLVLKFQAQNSLLSTYFRLPSIAMVPELWDTNTYLFYGGSPLCLYKSNTSLPQQSFTFDDDCERNELLTIDVTPMHLLYTMTVLPMANFTYFCKNNSDCLTMVHYANQIIKTSQLTDTTPLVTAASADIAMLNSGLMQFATDLSNEWQLLFIPLNTTLADSWGVFSWLLLFDWVIGRREIVQFDGDVASLVLVSGVSPSITIPSGTGQVGSTNTGNRIVFFLLHYVTAVLLFVAIVSVLYGVYYKFDILWSNIFYFNQLASIAWVGRPLLFLRGACALIAMTTIPIKLSSEHDATRFIWPSRSILEIALLSGEALWIVYVVTDIFSFHALPSSSIRWFSTFLVWVFLVLKSIFYPLNPTLSITPQCSSSDIDGLLICSSGVFSVGKYDDLIALLTICIGGAIIGVLAGFFLKSSSVSPILKPVTLMPPMATSCLKLHHGNYDAISCVMCGLIPIGSRVFSLKLWSFTSFVGTRSEKQLGLPGRKENENCIKTWLRQWRLKYSRARTVLGLCYIMSSLFGSILYLGTSAVSLSNDMLWTSFNMSTTHVFLSTWLYAQMRRGHPGNTEFTLVHPSINSINLPKAIRAAPHGGNLLQYSQLNNLEAVIAALRNNPVQDTCDRPWIFTQYCFVDFKKRWEMANSIKRQLRCQQTYLTTNAAVYLEAILRNLDWSSWRNCVGSAFDIAVGNYLRQSRQGQNWLYDLVDSKLSQADEMKYWVSHGLEHFTTQWQTYKTIGLINMYKVKNAYGIEYPFSMQSQNGTYSWSIATTHKMYWGFGNDLYAIMSNNSGIGGMSLIRSSPNFAFNNISLQDVYFNNGTLASPMSNSFVALSNTIGPFGAVDLYYISPPESLKALVRTTLDLLHTSFSQNPQSRVEFANIGTNAVMVVRPKVWIETNASSIGGSILCPSLSPKPMHSGLIALTSRYACPSSIYLDTMSKSPNYLILGAILSNASISDIPDLCNLVNDNEKQCTAFMTSAIKFVQKYFKDYTANSSLVFNELARLNISIVQFAQWPSETTSWIAQIPVFNTTSLPYFHWLFAYDWVLGIRDVINVNGDESSITIISGNINYYEQNIDTTQLPIVMSSYARACVNYVTFGMIMLAIFITVYIIYARGYVEGLNLLSLNGVGAMVWLGRPMLFVRSMTALGFLSSSTLKLVQTNDFYYFTSNDNARPWYTRILASSEVLWLVLISNDIAVVWTTVYTTSYVTLHRLLVWICAALLTTLNPVESVTKMSNECYIDQVDFQVVCTSALIKIGDVERLYSLICLVVGLQFILYGLVRGVTRRSLTDYDQDSFYYSGARYYFARSKWTYSGKEYIDPASAVLNGIIMLNVGNTQYIFDVKFWCIKAINTRPTEFSKDHPFLQGAKYAIQLNYYTNDKA